MFNNLFQAAVAIAHSPWASTKNLFGRTKKLCVDTVSQIKAKLKTLKPTPTEKSDEPADF